MAWKTFECYFIIVKLKTNSLRSLSNLCLHQSISGRRSLSIPLENIRKLLAKGALVWNGKIALDNYSEKSVGEKWTT